MQRVTRKRKTEGVEPKNKRMRGKPAKVNGESDKVGTAETAKKVVREIRPRRVRKAKESALKIRDDAEIKEKKTRKQKPKTAEKRKRVRFAAEKPQQQQQKEEEQEGTIFGSIYHFVSAVAQEFSSSLGY